MSEELRLRVLHEQGNVVENGLYCGLKSEYFQGLSGGAGRISRGHRAVRAAFERPLKRL